MRALRLQDETERVTDEGGDILHLEHLIIVGQNECALSRASARISACSEAMFPPSGKLRCS